MLRGALAALLSIELDIEVIGSFSDGEQALQAVGKHHPEVLVTDIEMPKMTGLELHQRLVASNRAIPTILMTAYPDERTQAQAIKAKVVCYLIKPIAADELLACVRRAVRRHDVGG